MIVTGRSLVDITNALVGEQHPHLVRDIFKLREQAERDRGETDVPDDLEDIADTLVTEALEIIEGPRPAYAEAAFYLHYAALLDARHLKLARAVGGRVKAVVRIAARLIDEAHRDDAEEGAAR